MAIYAADIQINVKNKGELRTLESRFKKIETAAVSLNKTLKGLGRRNAIRVDTRAAMSAISALEARIRGLNRTVNLDARTRESRSGGGSSGAAMPIIAASLGNVGLSSQEKKAFDKKRRITGGLEKPQEKEISQIESSNQALKTRLSDRSEILAIHRDEQKKLQEQLVENNKKFNEATEKSLKGVGQGRERKLRRDKLAAIKKENNAINRALTAKQKEVEVAQAKTEEINKEIRANNQKARVLEKPNRELQEKLVTDKKLLKQQEKINQAETIFSRLEAKKIQTGDKLKEVDEALAAEKKKLNTQLKKQENQLKKTTGRKIDYTKGISKGKKEVAKLTQQSEKFNRILKITDERMLKVTKTQRRWEQRAGNRGGLFGNMMNSKAGGAALRGGAASMALIPGIAPLAVGGFAGAANGGGLGGAGIGVAVAGLVQGTVALVEFSRQSAQVAADMDRMKTALSGVVPDQEAYNFALEKVKTLSDKYAISQRVLLKGFTGVQASADAANVSIEDTASLFEGLLAVTLAKGKGIEEFKGVSLATQQILSKGRPQAEELRGQISERVPGFMAGLAESMEIDMSELDKRMQIGKVSLEDFIKFGKKLKAENAKIAREMAQSMAFAGMRLTTAQENLQAEWGKTSMIFGATFQDMATVATKGLNKVAEAFNEVHKAELRRSIKHDPDWLFNLNPFTKNRKHQQDRLDVLTGATEVDTRTPKQKKLDEEKEAKSAANWKKIEDRLRIDKKFQENRIALGEKEAEIQRELAELRLQFLDKEDKDFDEIEKKIRALKDLEDQTISNSVAFKELQEDAAQRLKDLSNPINQLRVITETFEESFSSAIQEVVRGTRSIGDAVVSMLNRIADAMLENAANTIAAQASNSLLSFLGPAIQSIFSPAPAAPGPLPPVPNKITQTGFNYSKYAAGGYVNRPTNALIGEGSEGEYVIPESKLASSLSRYQAGHRGSSVVPGGVGNSGGSGGGSGEVTVNYTGPTLNFNGDEYVPRSAVPQIINSAAMAGASAGRASTMKDLKNSRSQRARLGL